MTITGKKFSQLTGEQKIATRVPITGWLVNSLFNNSTNYYIEFLAAEDINLLQSAEVPIVMLLTGGISRTIETSDEGSTPVGSYFYIVNWGVTAIEISAGEDVAVLPYASTLLKNGFGVFKIEKTNSNEWTISVVENGVLLDVGSIG